jgi:hypothetical protein
MYGPSRRLQKIESRWAESCPAVTRTARAYAASMRSGVRPPFYDVVPPPPDFVPASGALWKATRASAAKGRSAWAEITANLRAAIAEDLPAAVEAPARPGRAEALPAGRSSSRSQAA